MRFTDLKWRNAMNISTNISRLSALSGAALLAVTTSASAGPMSAAGSNVIAPTPQAQVEQVAYRHVYHHPYHHHHHYVHYRHHHRYYAVNPGAAVAGATLGLLSVPFVAAGDVAAATTGAWCDPYYGSCYYGGPYYYGRPYYSYYGHPYYRHYGYSHGGRRFAGYGGGIRTGRSVGWARRRLAWRRLAWRGASSLKLHAA